MKNIRILRKYTVTLALAVSAIVSQPETLLAQGAVIAYTSYRWHTDQDPLYYPQTYFPTNEQLFRLTHIMVVDRYVSPDGTLHTDTLPDRWE